MAEKLNAKPAPNVTDETVLEYYGRTAITLRKLDSARTEHMAEMKRAKAAGVSNKMMSDMHRDRKRDPDEIVLELKNRVRALALINMPVTQIELFPIYEPSESIQANIERLDAEAAGYEAGKGGQSRDDNPHTPGSAACAHWDTQWHEGTAEQAEPDDEGEDAPKVVKASSRKRRVPKPTHTEGGWA